MKRLTIIVLVTGFCLVAVLLLEGGGVRETASAASGKAGMPGVRVLDSLADRYDPVRFDHDMHTFIAERCGDCHHEHPVEAQRCRDCHSMDSSLFKESVVNTFLSCRTCHGKYDPANPDLPGLKVAYHRQCFKCHGGMGDIGKDPRGCTQQCHAAKGEKGRQ